MAFPSTTCCKSYGSPSPYHETNHTIVGDTKTRVVFAPDRCARTWLAIKGGRSVHKSLGLCPRVDPGFIGSDGTKAKLLRAPRDDRMLISMPYQELRVCEPNCEQNQVQADSVSDPLHRRTPDDKILYARRDPDRRKKHETWAKSSKSRFILRLPFSPFTALKRNLWLYAINACLLVLSRCPTRGFASWCATPASYSWQMHGVPFKLNSLHIGATYMVRLRNPV